MIVKTAAALLLLAFTVYAEYYPNGTHVPVPPPPGCGCSEPCGRVNVTVNLPEGGGSTGMDSDWKRRFLELEDQVKSLIARGVSGQTFIHLQL